MINKLRGLFAPKQIVETPAEKEDKILREYAKRKEVRDMEQAAKAELLINEQFSVVPVIAKNNMAMDGAIGDPTEHMNGYGWKYNHLSGMNPDQLMWFASHGFIGHQANQIIAQHWLVRKCCEMPARDATRAGWDYDLELDDGVDSDEQVKALKKLDKKYKLAYTMREMVSQGRMLGGRVVVFLIKDAQPADYATPFHPDMLIGGRYAGMQLVDPINVTAEVLSSGFNNPASPAYMRPEYYVIDGVRYHRSHVYQYVPYPVANELKPRYQFFGQSMPQMLADRVYAAERTADEAPRIAMSKRMRVVYTDMIGALSDNNELLALNAMRMQHSDNDGVFYLDRNEEKYEQHDTSLADFDALMMNQYQLVASIAEVPATKLIGTAPKGFNATGEHEAANYREMLESIQEWDLTQLAEEHYKRLVVSEALPIIDIDISWRPLDAPTAEQWATIEKTRADTAAVYLDKGVLAAEEVRDVLLNDKDSSYAQLANNEAEFIDNDNQEAEGFTI